MAEFSPGPGHMDFMIFMKPKDLFFLMFQRKIAKRTGDNYIISGELTQTFIKQHKKLPEKMPRLLNIPKTTSITGPAS
jgi:hypothetical protein